MKRYDNMTKAQIIDLLVSVSISGCSVCPMRNTICQSNNPDGLEPCMKTVQNWLFKDVNMVTRASTLKTAEDVKKARQLHSEICDKQYKDTKTLAKPCETCEYGKAKHSGYETCYDLFLSELIEVE